ncbi:Gfo/Idh/MocA family protein [Niveispirillum irakense]|uniref:Gfo/Idh/MocA family protein n=1 Tax=Niveispirillum irakense TaxID=34011 RepID=UPI0005593B40|nr:Gfo/Idh/MocA family oxidoreductase [Niveispirillum irakense]
MSYRVKVIGAGSIGNHLTNAARRMGWSVDMLDLDPAALKRTREQIYPSRYGAWDEKIGLYEAKDAPVGGYDLICIGTPPDSHIPLALKAVEERPRAILVEKPVCTPDLAGAQALHERCGELGIKAFTGYDHVVGKAARRFAELLVAGAIGQTQTLDVEFREYWGGIFAAHPWLSGPSDSYLGYWRRGGGACGEHSHAINLWQAFAHAGGFGRVAEVTGTLEYVNDGVIDYDSLCLLNVKTETGLIGRVVQDVVTKPTRKWARAQGTVGALEWVCGSKPGQDTVIQKLENGEATEVNVQKTRPDDFVEELRHIEAVLTGAVEVSPISLERGLESMMVVAAAHKSAAEKRTVSIDYTKGFRPEALV